MSIKVLIIRFSSIGDIVLTTPVIRVIKTQLYKCKIHFAVKKQYDTVLAANPYIDRFHFLEDSLWKLILQLRKEKFDYVVDLHNNLRTSIIKCMLGIPSFSFYKLNIEKWLMVNFKIDRLPRVHIVDRNLAAIESLGFKNDWLGLDFFILKKEVVPIWSLPVSHQSGYVAYAIGGQHNTKRLPVQKMIEVCDKINRPIVLLGGEEDWDDADQVEVFFNEQENKKGSKKRSALTNDTVIYNACGLYSIHQSASVIDQARFVVAHDTGMMHIAAGLKKKVLTIWGCTIPAFGMYPYGTQFMSLENRTLKCRPCSKIGFDKCPKGHFDCMYKIDFDAELLSMA